MKKFLSLILTIFAFLIVFNSNVISSHAYAASEYKGMVVIEQNSKRVLNEYNKNQRFAMASTTKIMTALITLKNYPDLDKKITIDDRAVGIEGTSMYLRKGEELTIRELLFGMLLPSGNDAATALALSMCENMSDFANIMNEEASKLGLENTHFMNSHGLDEKDHYISAYDLAIIAAEAMKYQDFRDIVNQPSTTITGAGGEQGDVRYLKNKNKFIKMFDGATGIKTGFTDNAGRCLVASSTRGKMNLICVVLNCPTMFESACKLMEDAYQKFNYIELIPAYNCYRKIDVIDGRQTEVKLYTCKGFSYPLTQDEISHVIYDYNLPNSLVAPIKKEEIVGSLEIKLDDELLFKENIYAMDEIKSTTFLDNFEQVLENWY